MFARALDWEIAKVQKNTVLLTRNPYRLWSFQLGAENMSKIGSFSENIVFYVTKLNHGVLHHFPGARMLIWPFSCSIVINCIKVWKLSAGNFRVKKNVELRTRNAQLPCNPNDYLQKTSYFTQYNYDGNPKIWLLDESSNESECPEATCGESSHGNGYTEVTWGENTGSSALNGPFLQSSTPEIEFSLELLIETIRWEIRKLFFNAVSKPSQIKLKYYSNLNVLVKSCGGPLWTSRSGS